jgi:murein DD-endopeptidase MepM/ murein hydrolase activator NlpD
MVTRSVAFAVRVLQVHEYKILLTLLLVTVLTGCPHYNTGLPPNLRLPGIQPNLPAKGLYHPVRQNQNLSAIAKAYDVNAQHLAEVNNLTPPYNVKADSKIFVPGASQVKEVRAAKEPRVPAPTVETFTGLLSWPVNGKIVSEFGVRNGTQHNGIAIQSPEGTLIRAAGNGKVGHVGKIPGLGNVVLIEHPDRLVTVYAHLKEIRVKQGTAVNRGRIIGSVGSSGRAATPSLYFEVRSRSKPRNPLFFLDRRT